MIRTSDLGRHGDFVLLPTIVWSQSHSMLLPPEFKGRAPQPFDDADIIEDEETVLIADVGCRKSQDEDSITDQREGDNQ